jgi:hypothetical protein
VETAFIGVVLAALPLISVANLGAPFPDQNPRYNALLQKMGLPD